MDLKELDVWTREALEHEARRRGIIDADLRSRGELIRLIVQSGYSRALSQGARRIARGFKSIEQARDMLSIAIETAADLRARLPLPGRTGRTLVGMPTPLAGATSTSTSTSTSTNTRTRTRTTTSADAGTGTGTGTGTETVAEAVAVADAVAVAVAAPVPVPVSAPVLESVSAARELTPGPSFAARVGGREPAAAREPVRAGEPGTHSFVDEPIRTHSMARLLAAQGHAERAIAIYEELLAQNSEASGLQDELAALRRGEAPAQPEAGLPQPPTVKLPDTGDRLSCERGGGDALELTWNISDAGRARARAVLGDEGELTVRLVRICPDPERVVRSEITEHGPVAASGRWQTAGAVAGERWVAAVGLRTGRRFVSIAHSGV